MKEFSRCPSCGCAVDEQLKGHHSAAGCSILKYAEAYAARALPPEPRTCETCDQIFDWIKKNTGWSICDPDTGDVDRNGETYRQLFDIVIRSPQSADVEMVREARKYVAEIVRAANANEGYVSCFNAVSLATQALAALDRIVGKGK